MEQWKACRSGATTKKKEDRGGCHQKAGTRGGARKQETSWSETEGLAEQGFICWASSARLVLKLHREGEGKDAGHDILQGQ
jgi:hypothetical protein